MFEKTIHSHTAFTGKLLKLDQVDIQMEDGAASYREIVRHPGGIAVVARLSHDRFILVRQFRKAVEQVSTEVVAGLLDAGESPMEAARRELEEETGFRARTIEHLGTVYTSPGYVDEKLELFLADLDEQRGVVRLDHDERVVAVEMTRDEWSASIRSGEIKDAKTLAAWALLMERERLPGESP